MNERLINYAIETLEKRAQDDNNRYSDIEQFCYDSLIYLLIDSAKNEDDTTLNIER